MDERDKAILRYLYRASNTFGIERWVILFREASLGDPFDSLRMEYEDGREVPSSEWLRCKWNDVESLIRQGYAEGTVTPGKSVHRVRLSREGEKLIQREFADLPDIPTAMQNVYFNSGQFGNVSVSNQGPASISDSAVSQYPAEVPKSLSSSHADNSMPIRASAAFDPSKPRQPKREVPPVFERALVSLLAHQFPWGEWATSGPRPGKEDSAGEAGPEPFVSVTIFGLEALSAIPQEIARPSQQAAMDWLGSTVAQGWSRVRAPTFRSASPHEVKRQGSRPLGWLPSVRHTAGVATALLRWGIRREPLASLLRSLVSSELNDPGSDIRGKWPDGPDDVSPILLNSLFAVEALGYAFSGRHPIPAEDLFENLTDRAEAALQHGLSTIRKEFRRHGENVFSIVPRLVGLGMTLYRMATLVGQSSKDLPARSVVDNLIEMVATELISHIRASGGTGKMLAGNSVPMMSTTDVLRILTGLSMANKAGFSIPAEILQATPAIVESHLSAELASGSLDPVDSAYALIWFSSHSTAVLSSEQLQRIPLAVERAAFGPTVRSLSAFQQRREAIEDDRKEGVPGYEELAHDLDEKIRLLLRRLSSSQ